MRTETVTAALAAVVRTRCNLAGAITNPDHRPSRPFRVFADAELTAGVRQSMSAIGSSADKAATESFNATSKRDALKGRAAGQGSTRPASAPSTG
ncbi:hypothetical protein [Streptomyces sp. NRRL S-104]|uniref:hypothetical protein n=1 Tax=Streptomyces sp. NRRL S-104 TaxID=1609135 RepID=UPI00131A95A9|nr:hypothetical protein [Streptomyces sp. NRRL S-104]